MKLSSLQGHNLIVHKVLPWKSTAKSWNSHWVTLLLKVIAAHSSKTNSDISNFNKNPKNDPSTLVFTHEV